MTLHTITETADGTRLVVRVGDSLALTLSDNPTTGYRWELVAIDRRHLVLDDESYVGAHDRVGAGGTAAWVVRAVRAGTTSLAAKRWRPWEGEGSVIERFTVFVEIAGGGARTGRGPARAVG